MKRTWKLNKLNLKIGDNVITGLTVLATAAALTSILLNIEFNLLESNLYDFKIRNGIAREASQDIMIVMIDEKTTKALNDFAPFDLTLHTRFLSKLKTYNPRGVGYLVNMNHVNQVNPELFKQKEGLDFMNVASEYEASGIPFILGTPFDINGEILPPFPLSNLRHGIASIHRDGNVFSRDNVTRRAMVTLYNRSTFHYELAQKTGGITSGKTPKGTFYVPDVDGNYFFFRYHGSTENGVELPYKTISFIDVLEGNVDPKLLEGKMLLVGTMVKENPDDFTRTPFTRHTLATPKLFVHANILDSIIQDDGIILAPNWVTGLFTFVLVSFVLWFVLTSTPLSGVFTTIGLLILFLSISVSLFHGIFSDYGIWIRESQPIIGIFLAYYIAVPYRLIREYKKRWEYQRQNELLRQVEELKTNFLSLVTHDLKTPVARIQGLTEMLLQQTKNVLQPKDLESFKHILFSTDELNRFISSILELTRIESDPIQIKLESKDINLIVEKSLEALETHARAKGITIKTQLEPLFPIKIDPTLISKVINNVVDNAIKYSKPGSEIQIISQETPQGVQLSIQDTGIGLSAEDQKRLFSKFFRAKNDETTQVAGTGLGLYLSRYFVEAHQGTLSVESQVGQGSRFDILLPQDLKEADLKKHSMPGLHVKRIKKIIGSESEPKENRHV